MLSALFSVNPDCSERSEAGQDVSSEYY